jgi:hypothetical protein
MKIDTTDFGVFQVEVSHEDANGWLMDEGADLVEVNSAIDEATSHAAHHGRAFILIEITPPLRQGESRGR